MAVGPPARHGRTIPAGFGGGAGDCHAAPAVRPVVFLDFTGPAIGLGPAGGGNPARVWAGDRALALVRPGKLPLAAAQARPSLARAGADLAGARSRTHHFVAAAVYARVRPG